MRGNCTPVWVRYRVGRYTLQLEWYASKTSATLALFARTDHDPGMGNRGYRTISCHLADDPSTVTTALIGEGEDPRMEVWYTDPRDRHGEVAAQENEEWRRGERGGLDVRRKR